VPANVRYRVKPCCKKSGATIPRSPPTRSKPTSTGCGRRSRKTRRQPCHPGYRSGRLQVGAITPPPRPPAACHNHPFANHSHPQLGPSAGDLSRVSCAGARSSRRIADIARISADPEMIRRRIGFEDSITKWLSSVKLGRGWRPPSPMVRRLFGCCRRRMEFSEATTSPLRGSPCITFRCQEGPAKLEAVT
jgi:hypothetical protein